MDATRRERMDRTALEGALREAGATVRGTSVRCPFHDDRHPSGAIFRGDDGAWRFKCHASECGFAGDVYDVRARATGRPLKAVLPGRADRRADRAPRRFATVEAMAAAVGLPLEATYRYTNPATGRVDLVVMRFADGDRGKTFRQGRPDGDGYVLAAPPKPWPLYNRTRIARASAVVVVEGEKCVHALTQAGVVATTAPAGAGKASAADWTPLAGKTVTLWPDHDDAGRAHMEGVAACLEVLDPPPRLRWVDPSSLDLPVTGDAADLLERAAADGGAAQRAAVRAVLDVARPLGAAAALEGRLEATLAGRHEAIAWPWPALSRYSRALLPGTVTVLCGQPGAAKSFMLLEAALYWHGRGRRVALYALEEDRTHQLHRALALQAASGELLDDAWMRDNPDDVREAYCRHEAFLADFARCLHEPPDAGVTADDLAAWVERQVAAGVEIVAIDPITAMAPTEAPWIQDHRFLMRAKQALRRRGARLVLVTHPRKGHHATPRLDDMAGGSSWQRFAQTVLWLQRHDPPERVAVRTALGPVTEAVNRTLHLCKVRNGPGAGARLAFHMGTTCRLREVGLIVGPAKETTDR